MTKRIIIACFLLALLPAIAVAQDKEVYIPKDIRAGFENPNSNWCRQRMKLTPNFTILWEKGFGADPMKAPPLGGVDMTFDINAFGNAAEEIYDMYKNRMRFVGPNSNCDRYRMLIFVKYSNERTALGGCKDKTIGAVWQINPRNMRSGWNMLAHELGHCFQQQVGCDKRPQEFFGHKHGFYDMCSQWGLWNYLPDWVGNEGYHLDNYITMTHKPFFHRKLCGEAPYVLEYWSEEYGLTFIGQLFSEGCKDEDVVTVYKRMRRMTQEAFCDELFDAFRHTVNLDFKLNWSGNRQLGLKFGMDCRQDGSYWQVPVNVCPESYGFNALNINIPQPGHTVRVLFEGIMPQSPYVSKNPDKAGWRYGFVMVDDKGKSHYGQCGSAARGSISFTAPNDITVRKLWLIVMGAPTSHWDIADDVDNIDAQWPYRICVNAL